MFVYVFGVFVTIRLQKRQSTPAVESPKSAAIAASAAHSDPDSPVRAKPEDPSVLVAASASTDDDLEAFDAHEFIVDTHGLPADDSVRTLVLSLAALPLCAPFHLFGLVPLSSSVYECTPYIQMRSAHIYISYVCCYVHGTAHPFGVDFNLRQSASAQPLGSYYTLALDFA